IASILNRALYAIANRREPTLEEDRIPRAREEAMEAFSYPVESLHQLTAWLFANILTFANLVQIPAVAITGAAAWLVSRPLQRQIAVWLARAPATSHLEWIARYQTWVVDRLMPLIAPAIWVTGLWIAVVAAQYLYWPHDVARIAANL